MRLILRICTCLIVIFSATTSNGQSSGIKTLMIGTWKFDKFEFVGDFAGMDKTEQAHANKMNEDKEISFTNDDKFKTVKRVNNKLTTLASGQFKVFNDGRHFLFEGEKAEILFIDSTSIKFTMPDRPIMVLTKVKS